MSDHEWQSPENASRAENPPVPPVEPTTPPGGYSSSPQASPGQQPGWTPPPKPGLIPLRPLDLGAILGGSIAVLRRNPKPTFGVAMLIMGVLYIVTAGIVGVVTFLAVGRISSSTNQDLATITAGAYGAIALSLIVPILLGFVASALLQGIVVVEISRGSVGEKLRLRELWNRVRGRLAALIGWTVLVAVIVAGALAILIGLIVAFVLFLGELGTVAAVVVGIFGGLGVLVVGIWIGTKLSLVPSAIMIERMTVRQAVGRSWSLTNGYFWRAFGIQLLVNFILNVVSQVVTVPVSFVTPMLVTLLDPNGQQGATTTIVTAAISIITLIVIVVFGAITSVVQSAVTALIYLDLRIRKEGLDLELARYVEARTAGDTTVTDPYLRPTGAVAAAYSAA